MNENVEQRIQQRLQQEREELKKMNISSLFSRKYEQLSENGSVEFFDETSRNSAQYPSPQQSHFAKHSPLHQYLEQDDESVASSLSNELHYQRHAYQELKVKYEKVCADVLDHQKRFFSQADTYQEKLRQIGRAAEDNEKALSQISQANEKLLWENEVLCKNLLNANYGRLFSTEFTNSFNTQKFNIIHYDKMKEEIFVQNQLQNARLLKEYYENEVKVMEQQEEDKLCNEREEVIKFSAQLRDEIGRFCARSIGKRQEIDNILGQVESGLVLTYESENKILEGLGEFYRQEIAQITEIQNQNLQMRALHYKQLADLHALCKAELLKKDDEIHAMKQHIDALQKQLDAENEELERQKQLYDEDLGKARESLLDSQDEVKFLQERAVSRGQQSLVQIAELKRQVEQLTRDNNGLKLLIDKQNNTHTISTENCAQQLLRKDQVIQELYASFCRTHELFQRRLLAQGGAPGPAAMEAQQRALEGVCALIRDVCDGFQAAKAHWEAGVIDIYKRNIDLLRALNRNGQQLAAHSASARQSVHGVLKRQLGGVAAHGLDLGRLGQELTERLGAVARRVDKALGATAHGVARHVERCREARVRAAREQRFLRTVHEGFQDAVRQNLNNIKYSCQVGQREISALHGTVGTIQDVVLQHNADTKRFSAAANDRVAQFEQLILQVLKLKHELTVVNVQRGRELLARERSDMDATIESCLQSGNIHDTVRALTTQLRVKTEQYNELAIELVNMVSLSREAGWNEALCNQIRELERENKTLRDSVLGQSPRQVPNGSQLEASDLE